MKKVIFATAALAAVLVGVIVGSRRPAADTSAAGPAGVPAKGAPSSTEPVDGQRKGMAQRLKNLKLGSAILAATAQNPQEVPEAPSGWERARDSYYDRLLVKQGRDLAKEQQLGSRMMTAFGDRADTLVGGTACSGQFCRVELRAVGKVDVRARWQPDVISAVDPKGLRIFIIDEDDDGNTIMSFYFGRDESWTVPDFHALGML